MTDQLEEITRRYTLTDGLTVGDVGWLLSEVERLQRMVKDLRTDAAIDRHTNEDARDILLERHADEERALRADLAAERERREALEKALPDQAVLEAAAALLKYWNELDQTVDKRALHEAAAQLSAAAALIRKVQESVKWE